MKPRGRWGQALIAGSILACLAAVVALAAMQRPALYEIGAYTTSFRYRDPEQRENALRAAAALDGLVLPPGAEFSYNRSVGPWTADRGFRKAPVSFDGHLLPSFGGGVCQTSTTLYNAALLAGLTVVERHRHAWCPKYIAPGLDAAVAQPDIDLRLRNPYPFPLTLRAAGDADTLRVRILAPERVAPARIATVVRAVDPEDSVVRTGYKRPHLQVPGQPGVRVEVQRITAGRAGERRELISRDTYPPVTRVVALPD